MPALSLYPAFLILVAAHCNHDAMLPNASFGQASFDSTGNLFKNDCVH